MAYGEENKKEAKGTNMRIIVPEYYPEFHCIAEKCHHSCCIGWEIDIDPESHARYQAVGGEIGKRLACEIAMEDGSASFVLREDERCPFLNEWGLCDLILELGEGSLCQICADHPRFRVYFSDRTEIGLGLCCEEAARLILTRRETTGFTTLEDDGAEEPLLPEEQARLHFRERMIALAQDRSMPFEQRVEKMLSEAQTPMPQRAITRWAEFFLGLERLDNGWTARLNALCSEQSGEQDEKLPQEPQEQLLVYFLFRHCAAESGLAAESLMLCVLLWRIVRRIWAQEGGGVENLCDIARMCSGEIEYSQENIDAIIDEITALCEETEI